MDEDSCENVFMIEVPKATPKVEAQTGTWNLEDPKMYEKIEKLGEPMASLCIHDASHCLPAKNGVHHAP